MENLPTEIQLLILCAVTHVSFLRALIHASPVLHRTYRSHRKEILSEVLLRQVCQDGVSIRDLLAAILSRPLHPHRDASNLEAIILFLRRYSRADDDDEYFGHARIKGLALDECLALVTLDRVADFFVEDFCRSAIFSWSSLRGGVEVQGDFWLSSSEKRRLKRAIYRWEFHHNLFGSQRRDEEGDGAEHDCTDFELDQLYYEHEGTFFALFRPWETEEIGSFHDYAFRRYRDLLTAILTPSDEVYSLCQDAANPFALFGKCFNQSNDPLLMDYIDHMVFLGPCFLHDILHTRDYQRRWDMIQHNLHVDSPLLFRESGEEDFQEQEELQFCDDDSETGPNAGWELVHGHQGRFFLINPTDSTLRGLGYVIWDKEKIGSGGMFDLQLVLDNS